MLLNKNNLIIGDLASRDTDGPISKIAVFSDKTVVTDSYQMIMVALPEMDEDDYPAPVKDYKKIRSNGQPILFDPKHAKDVIKRFPKKSKLPILQTAVLVEDKKLKRKAIIATDLEQWTSVLASDGEGRYPDIYQVVPDPEDKIATINLSVDKLKDALDVLKKMGCKTITFTINGDTKPVTYQTKADPGLSHKNQHVFGMIMPVRV